MVFILKITISDLLCRDPTGHSLPNLNVLGPYIVLGSCTICTTDLDYSGLSEGMST